MSIVDLPSIDTRVGRPVGRVALVATLAAAVAFDIGVRSGVAVLAGAVTVLVVSGLLLA